MALRKTLWNQFTSQNIDVIDGYWRIEDIRVVMTEHAEVLFALRCYSNREAARQEERVPETIDVGGVPGSLRHFYEWEGSFPWSSISAESLPTTVSEIRKRLYPCLKSFVQYLQDAEDVIEPGQQGGEA